MEKKPIMIYSDLTSDAQFIEITKEERAEHLTSAFNTIELDRPILLVGYKTQVFNVRKPSISRVYYKVVPEPETLADFLPHIEGAHTIMFADEHNLKVRTVTEMAKYQEVITFEVRLIKGATVREISRNYERMSKCILQDKATGKIRKREINRYTSNVMKYVYQLDEDGWL